MNQKTKTFIKSLLLVIGFVASVTAVAVWTPPDADPLSKNTSSPINVGPFTQSKPDAGLVLGFLRVGGLAWVNGNAQIDGTVTIGTGGSSVRDSSANPTRSAALEITSTDKGLLLPRLTQAERDAIAGPVAGLMIYQTDNNPGLRIYNGVAWDGYSKTGDTTLR